MRPVCEARRASLRSVSGDSRIEVGTRRFSLCTTCIQRIAAGAHKFASPGELVGSQVWPSAKYLPDHPVEDLVGPPRTEEPGHSQAHEEVAQTPRRVARRRHRWRRSPRPTVSLALILQTHGPRFHHRPGPGREKEALAAHPAGETAVRGTRACQEPSSQVRGPCSIGIEDVALHACRIGASSREAERCASAVS